MSFTARIEGPPYHRGASASKKDGLAAPLRPWTGQDACAAVTPYRQQLLERYEWEAQTLATLTGWNIGEIRKSMNIAALSTGDGKTWYERLWVN